MSSRTLTRSVPLSTSPFRAQNASVRLSVTNAHEQGFVPGFEGGLVGSVEVVVEPDEVEHLLVVVTAYPVEP